MDDIKRALPGDHEAAKRLTDAGMLLPCPWCGKMVVHAGTIAEHEYMDEDAPGYDWCATHYDAVCDATNGGCGGHTGPYKTEEEARLAWNTRAPILSEEEREMLERLEKEAGPCLVTLDEATEITQEQWEQLRSRIKRREADSC